VILSIEIQQRLQISYEAVKRENQEIFLDIPEIFLDIPCSIRGENRDMAIRIWERIGLEVFAEVSK